MAAQRKVDCAEYHLRTAAGETDCRVASLLAMTWKRVSLCQASSLVFHPGSAKRSGSARNWFRQTIPRLHPDMYNVRRSRCRAPSRYTGSSRQALFSLWADSPPLPVAEEGGLSAPQPRPWRAVAKQAREGLSRQGGRTVSLFGQVPKREMGLEYTQVMICEQDTGMWGVEGAAPYKGIRIAPCGD